MHRKAVLLAIVAGALMLMTAAARGRILAQEGNRAALVVRFDDERVESRCVAFDEAEISGYTLLQRSGLAADVKSEGQGGLVCAIDGTGCGVDNCLCQCQGDMCVYWSYWRLTDDSWAYSAAGSTLRRLTDGDVDGWSWGPGSVTSAVAPPAMTFDEICSGSAELVDGSVAPVDREQTPWLPYAVLGLLLAVIGLSGLLVTRRRNAT